MYPFAKKPSDSWRKSRPFVSGFAGKTKKEQGWELSYTFVVKFCNSFSYKRELIIRRHRYFQLIF